MEFLNVWKVKTGKTISIDAYKKYYYLKILFDAYKKY